MHRSFLLLTTALLAGCNVQTKYPANGDDKVSIQADGSGNIAFNLPIAEGQVKVPTSMMHHGDFDIDGVKLMPGSSITGFSVMAGDGKKSTVKLAFAAAAGPADVRSYYVDQFRKQSVQAAVSGDDVKGTSKDGSPFTINVIQAPTGATGSIVIEDDGRS